MFRSRQDAEVRLSNFLMDDLPIAQCAATPIPFPSDWFAKFRMARVNFLRSLDDSVSELAMLNLTSEDFMGLLSGKTIPENLSIKFKKPILYGGKIEPENMFLMPSFPFGFNLDIFMAEQFGSVEIWYPDPKKKIYISVRMLSGGAGGNATTDRLAQSFAQMANQNRGLE